MTQLFLRKILFQDFLRSLHELHCPHESLHPSRQELSHLRLIQGSMDKFNELHDGKPMSKSLRSDRHFVVRVSLAISNSGFINPNLAHFLKLFGSHRNRK